MTAVISERLANARRLELTDAVESGGHVEGQYRRVKVTLEDHGLERTVRLYLGRPPGWVTVGLRVHEVNDPDMVITGDAFFDEHISVLAEDGRRPQVAPVFASAALRTATHTFFKRYPNATFDGSRLTLPHVATSDTGTALEDASSLMLLLQKAVEGSAQAPLEAPPVLLPGRPWWKNEERTRYAATVAAMTLSAFSAVGLSIPLTQAFFPSQPLFGYIFTATVIYAVMGSGLVWAAAKIGRKK